MAKSLLRQLWSKCLVSRAGFGQRADLGADNVRTLTDGTAKGGGAGDASTQEQRHACTPQRNAQRHPCVGSFSIVSHISGCATIR